MTAAPARTRRTFVISDAHGYPALIENALEHGGFRPGADDFVFAGDLLDRGPDVESCIDLVDRYATEILVGNHELAVLLDFAMAEMDPYNRRYRQLLLDRVLAAPASGVWKAATCVGGILVTHAGLSARFGEAMGLRHPAGDPARVAADLNRDFVAAVRHELQTGEWDDRGILGDFGPLWFRPRPYSSGLPFAGITQVAGHTPPVKSLAPLGFHMTDPCAYRGMVAPGQYRYAVIEDGSVRVEDGVLASTARAGAGWRGAPAPEATPR